MWKHRDSDSGDTRVEYITGGKYNYTAIITNKKGSNAAYAGINETGFGIKTVNRAVKSLTEAGLITKQERSLLVNHQQYLSLKKLVHTIVAPESDD